MPANLSTLFATIVSDITEACKGVDRPFGQAVTPDSRRLVRRGNTTNPQVLALVRTAIGYESLSTKRPKPEELNLGPIRYSDLGIAIRSIANQMVRNSDDDLRWCGQLRILGNGEVYSDEKLPLSWYTPESSVLNTWADDFVKIMEGDTPGITREIITVENGRFSFRSSDPRVKELHELIGRVRRTQRAVPAGFADDAVLLYLLKVLIIGTENLPEGFLEASIMYDGRLVEGRTK
jgi:hypothetical protein